MIDGKQIKPQTVKTTQINVDADLDIHGHKLIDVANPTAATDGANKQYVDAAAVAAIAAAEAYTDAAVAAEGAPTVSNKDMVAEVTVNDFDEACATGIAATPVRDSYVQVFVNGVKTAVGNGVKTKACYFSGDSGTTARAISAIVSGDKLYWVGSVAGYQLAVTDLIDLDYVA
jgi:hypothetical protein